MSPFPESRCLCSWPKQRECIIQGSGGCVSGPSGAGVQQPWEGCACVHNMSVSQGLEIHQEVKARLPLLLPKWRIHSSSPLQTTFSISSSTQRKTPFLGLPSFMFQISSKASYWAQTYHPGKCLGSDIHSLSNSFGGVEQRWAHLQTWLPKAHFCVSGVDTPQKVEKVDWVTPKRSLPHLWVYSCCVPNPQWEARHHPSPLSQVVRPDRGECCSFSVCFLIEVQHLPYIQ